MTETSSGFETNNADMESRLETAVKASSADNYLPCAVAFQTAKKLGVSRRQVGDTANKLKVRIIDCQLDCFTLEKAVHDLDSIHISQVLADEVEASLIDGRLPCGVAFKITKKLKVAPKKVADAANKLKIKIADCQLGCFP